MNDKIDEYVNEYLTRKALKEGTKPADIPSTAMDPDLPSPDEERERAPVDAFYIMYNRLVAAGVRLPVVKYVSMRDRMTFPDDGVIRIDDDGNLRIRFRKNSSVVGKGSWFARTNVERIAFYKALNDAGMLLEWLTSRGKSHSYAATHVRYYNSNATD